MMSSSQFLYAVVLSITLTCCRTIHSLVATASSTNESDRLALLAFKDQITVDPFGVLNSWNDSTHYCTWTGVACSGRHIDRVAILELGSQKLEGTLSPFIGNLSFLRKINLSENTFHGAIPQEIGRLFRLRILFLDSNLLEGDIPTSLTHCVNLRAINLLHNKLSGGIPNEITSLSKLFYMVLGQNELKGTIPSFLGNLSSLRVLSLPESSLIGSIPDDLCRIQSLEFFQLSGNNLTGTVPTCIFNLSHITTFSLTNNQLDGSLPQDISHTLPNLVELYMGLNRFRGLIPLSFSNASSLEVVSLYDNQFVGQVPKDLGRLQNLRTLSIFSNQLGSSFGDDLNFITSLTNCSNLEEFTIFDNFLKGPMPDSIANLSTEITFLNLGNNQIHGTVPAGIKNLVNLNEINFAVNHLSGEFPNFIGMLPKLQKLYFHENQFSGEIPPFSSNSTLLSVINLSGNKLHGQIHPSLENCQKLIALYIAGNRLTGTIPKEVIGLFSAIAELSFSNNALSGHLPSEVGNLSSLVMFDVSGNRLSGNIPDTLGLCLTIVALYMEDNLFEGRIPQSFSNLKGMEEFDLSKNKLSGEIPYYLANFTGLTYVNLSYNELEGSVPKDGVFANVSETSVVGNSKLCGGVVGLKLLPCSIQTIKKTGKRFYLKIVIPIVLISFCCPVLYVLFMCYRKRTSKNESSSMSVFSRQHKRISYGELLKATNGFSTDNLIGSGSYGSVYKGFLDQINATVAVKVFNLQQQGAIKSFLSECNALRNLRHRNLLKIVTVCSSADFQGNDFKALVFEFMPNGDLDEWIHPKRDGEHELRNLSFLRRLNIVIDVASALDYLHHQCQPAIIHCDLKPSNVLLDEDMTAHVADFGLTKIFSESSYSSLQNQESSLTFKGSIGYVAPEYGMGAQASREGDVFSYGILVLEMFTGKRPIDEMFQNGQSLHSFVKAALHEQVMDIMDPRMFLEDSDEDNDITKQSDIPAKMQAYLVTVLKLGVKCSAEFANERMNIGEVLSRLYDIRYHHQGLITTNLK